MCIVEKATGIIPFLGPSHMPLVQVQQASVAPPGEQQMGSEVVRFCCPFGGLDAPRGSSLWTSVGMRARRC